VQPIGLGGADVSLGASGFYTDYEAANDNYRFALNADWSGPFRYRAFARPPNTNDRS